MKLLHVGYFVAISFGISRAVWGQGFANFDFEDANLPVYPAPASPVQVSFANAFPGWTGYIGTSQATIAFDNGISLGSALTTLLTPNASQYSGLVIGGFYTAVISSGSNPAMISQILPASLAQTGLVPIGTQSLIFNLGSASRLDTFSVTFNGQNLSLVPISTGANYMTYGADLSAFAGTSGELRFTEAPTVSSPFNNGYLDDISFSTQAVPEPSVFGLAGLGILFFWRRRRVAG